EHQIRQLTGSWLVQDAHHFASTRDDWRVVTKREPTEAEWADAELAWRLVGWVKSNSIVLVKDGTAWGIGAGQQNRVEAGQIAASKAAGRAKGGACASDAFYPFPDGIEAAADAGVAVVIQPGGSVLGTRACVPRLRSNDGGAIVVTASVAGVIAFGGNPIYTLTKQAVAGFVAAVAPSLEPSGITIDAVCPGVVDTPMTASALG